MRNWITVERQPDAGSEVDKSAPSTAIATLSSPRP
jgi:hypothetical protein